jgi:hypothetical protein
LSKSLSSVKLDESWGGFFGGWLSSWGSSGGGLWCWGWGSSGFSGGFSLGGFGHNLLDWSWGFDVEVCVINNMVWHVGGPGLSCGI